jgi:hypothetical protein
MSFPFIAEGSLAHSPKDQKLSFLVLLVLLYGLYGSVAIASYGFDDEFFNIRIIEGFSFADGIAAVQSGDVHPPLSYVYNYFLYWLSGTWPLVRLVGSIALVTSLAWYSLCTWRRDGWRHGILFLLFAGLNPSILMWGTSIRWYSLYLIILLWMLAPQIPDSQSSPGPIKSLRSRWIHLKLVFSLLLLGYTGYVTIILALPLTIFYYYNSVRLPGKRIRSCLFSFLAFLILYSHQLYIFITVHFLNRGSQSSSLSKSAIGFVVAEISNQGVFPLSLAGFVSAISILAFVLCVALLLPSQKMEYKGMLMSYFLASFLLVLTGLAGKFRNFVVIDPLKSACLASFNAKSRQGGKLFLRITACSMALILFSQAYGVANVVAHQGTIKNNWNIPAADVFSIVKSASLACSGGLAVFSHEPIFDWNFRRLGYSVYGPYGEGYSSERGIAPECAVFVNTFRGSLDPNHFAQMKTELSRAIKNSRVNVTHLGRDHDFILKRKLDPDFPEYAVELIEARGALDLSQLRSWRPIKK